MSDEPADRNEDPDVDLLSCGYPRVDVEALQYGHSHSYHCHLSLDNYW